MPHPFLFRNDPSAADGNNIQILVTPGVYCTLDIQLMSTPGRPPFSSQASAFSTSNTRWRSLSQGTTTLFATARCWSAIRPKTISNGGCADNVWCSLQDVPPSGLCKEHHLRMVTSLQLKQAIISHPHSSSSSIKYGSEQQFILVSPLEHSGKQLHDL